MENYDKEILLLKQEMYEKYCNINSANMDKATQTNSEETNEILVLKLEVYEKLKQIVNDTPEDIFVTNKEDILSLQQDILGLIEKKGILTLEK